jgi:hypothetical protein
MKNLTMPLILFLSISAVTGHTLTNYTKSNSGLASNTVRAVCSDAYGMIWFGTDNGLCRFDGTNWVTYKTGDRIASDQIYDIAFDQGLLGPEIWVTTGNGISVINVAEGSVIIADPYRSSNSGLVSDMVYAVGADINHVKWLGTDKGAASYNGSAWGRYTVEEWYLYVNTVWAIGNGPDGWNYLATEGGGVTRIRMDNVDGVDVVTTASIIEKTWSQVGSDSVYDVYISPDNIRWFGTPHCLSRHEGDETREGWTVYTTAEGLVNNWVLSICRDHTGNIWAGTKGGVSILKGGGFQSLTTANGLAGNMIYDMDVDLNGDVWLATDGGVTKYSTGTAVTDRPSPQNYQVGSIFNYPNPFNMGTTIEFQTSRSGYTTATIFSVNGQKVRDVLAGHMDAGRHTVQWNGSDDDGQFVPSGVYFIRIVSGSTAAVHKMVIAK